MNNCPSCAKSTPENAKFCPSCGVDLKKIPLRNINPGQYFLVLGLGLALFAFAWGTQGYLAGTKPTAKFEGEPQKETVALDTEELKALRQKAESAPQDKEAQRALVYGLLQASSAAETPPTELIFETIDALSRILKLDPKDAESLIMMGDISFDQQAFPKAAEFYKRYLDQESGDVSVRARYASSLTFMGKGDEAIKELKAVVAKDPKNFQANAYLAISYAQLGETTKAIEIGETALALAPSEEAKGRFADFLESVKSKRGNLPEKQKGASDLQSGSAPKRNSGDTIAEFVSANPIAGPKLVQHKSEGEVLSLYFKDFPMANMPPFAKDKFFGGIKTKVADEGISDLKSIVFIDIATGKEMEKLALKS